MTVAFFATAKDAAEFERRIGLEMPFSRIKRVPFDEVAMALPELGDHLKEDIQVIDATQGRVRRSSTVPGSATFSREYIAVGYR